MKIVKATRWLKQLGLLVGVAGLGSLALSFSALAQFYPHYRFFNPGPRFESDDLPTLAETLKANRSFKTLAQAVQKVNLTQLLSQDKTFLTILAPTEQAFATLPPGLLNQLLLPENREVLHRILLYHVISSQVTDKELATGELKTVEGSLIKINRNSNATALLINDATAKDQPITAKNGIIVSIDKVLLPPGLLPLVPVSGLPPTMPVTPTLPPSPAPSPRSADPTQTDRVATATATSFICAAGANGLPTTYAVTPRGKVPVITWFSDYFTGAGYTPERRCQEVTSRFQNFYNAGQLNFITSGYVNGQAVVCVASNTGNPCAGNSVLFTLKPGSNATETVQRLFNIRAGASSPLYESQDDANSVYIDFRQFLNTTHVEGGGISNPATGNPGSRNSAPPTQNSRPGGSPVW